MPGLLRKLSLQVLLVATLPLQAAENVSGLEDPDHQARFRELTWELRCPKCQNQNLADSNAPVAADLRGEISRMLREGRSNAEIVDFMVTRYGEFVLYEPRVQGAGLLLWGFPVLALLVGAVVILLRLRAGRAAETELSEAEEQRVQELLSGRERRR